MFQKDESRKASNIVGNILMSLRIRVSATLVFSLSLANFSIPAAFAQQVQKRIPMTQIAADCSNLPGAIKGVAVVKGYCTPPKSGAIPNSTNPTPISGSCGTITLSVNPYTPIPQSAAFALSATSYLGDFVAVAWSIFANNSSLATSYYLFGSTESAVISGNLFNDQYIANTGSGSIAANLNYLIAATSQGYFCFGYGAYDTTKVP
jgi:hypothetical protein